MVKKEVFEAIATLIGTVIGAGILGIPYIIAKHGVITGVINIVLIGTLVLFMNLFLGEVALRTKGNHQLTGYAERYLGKTGKMFMLFSMIFGIYGALTAYLIGEGQALSTLFGGKPFFWSLAFFVVVSAIVYKGLKAVEESELWLGLGLLAAVVVLIIFSFTRGNVENLKSVNVWGIMPQFGVILFAFLGSAAIPEMREELANNRDELKRCILIGSLMPVAVYVLFALAVVSVTGISTTQIATIGLGAVLGEKMLILSNIFAVFNMATSFIALGLALKEVYHFDYEIRESYSWAMTCGFPLILFAAGITSFIQILGIAGSFAGGVTGILAALMLWRAKKHGDRKPEYSLRFAKPMGWLIIIIFSLGIVYQILSFFRGFWVF